MGEHGVGRPCARGRRRTARRRRGCGVRSAPRVPGPARTPPSRHAASTASGRQGRVPGDHRVQEPVLGRSAHGLGQVEGAPGRDPHPARRERFGGLGQSRFPIAEIGAEPQVHADHERIMRDRRVLPCCDAHEILSAPLEWARGTMARPRTADKRKRILQAAVAVFARKGYFGARVSEIAKKAGVADGTIYLYFRNKEDILVSLFDDLMSEHVQQVKDALSVGARRRRPPAPGGRASPPGPRREPRPGGGVPGRAAPVHEVHGALHRLVAPGLLRPPRRDHRAWPGRRARSGPTCR